MSLDSKDKSSTASACITDEPSVTVSYFLKDLDCQLRDSLIFTNEAWLDSVKTRLGIAHVIFTEFFEFLQVFLKQAVEENDSLKVIINSLYNQMSQVLVLVGKQAQDLFNRHRKTRRQQQYQKLQRRLALIRVLLRVDPLDIQSILLTKRFIFDLGLG